VDGVGDARVDRRVSSSVDHYSVHEAGWQIRRLDDGTVQWISPTGHTYRVPPAAYPIDTTCQRPAEGEDRTDHGAFGPGETDEPPAKPDGQP
jgi:hypothetical protein